MAIFLYYCVEVNVMSWINGILITFISKLEWGTVADWVSGIGSCGAVIVALWQITVQRKKDSILANRPLFSLYKRTFITRGNDDIWTLVKDSGYSLNDFIKTPNKKDSTLQFKNGIYAYFFRNITQSAATSLTLKIEYQNKNTGKTKKIDCCSIETCVDGKETAIILPDSIIHETTEYAVCPKKIFLYFSSIDGNAFCQCWTEIEEKPGIYHFQEESIKKIKKESIPKENICNFTRFS